MPDSKEILVNTAPAKAGSIGHIRPIKPPLPRLLKSGMRKHILSLELQPAMPLNVDSAMSLAERKNGKKT